MSAEVTDPREQRATAANAAWFALRFALEPETWPVFKVYANLVDENDDEARESMQFCMRAMFDLADILEAEIGQ